MKFYVAEAVAVLERTPGVLQEFLGGLPAPWLHGTEGADSWSPSDILAHLIGGEETDWIARARVILARGPAPRFQPFDRVAAINRLRGQPLPELLTTFAEIRARNLEELARWRLTPDQLELTGVHPEFGSVTMEQLLATWVVHDLGHLAQVARVMARQYRTEVGPWQQYLPVLTR